MIEITQNDSKILIKIDTGVGFTISPEFNTGNKLYAILLRDKLIKEMG